MHSGRRQLIHHAISAVLSATGVMAIAPVGAHAAQPGPAASLLDTVAPIVDPVLAPVDGSSDTPTVRPLVDDLASSLDDVMAATTPEGAAALDEVVDDLAAVTQPAVGAVGNALADVTPAARPATVEQGSNIAPALHDDARTPVVPAPAPAPAGSDPRDPVRHTGERSNAGPHAPVPHDEGLRSVDATGPRFVAATDQRRRRSDQQSGHDDHVASTSAPVGALAALAFLPSTRHSHGRVSVAWRREPARAPPDREIPTKPD